MTTQYHPGDLSSLKGKVIVVTGGALGVGASLVRILHSAGAHVYFGDILTEPGEKLASCLSNSCNTAKFLHVDVTSYSSNLSLFRTAFEAHHRIDHAIAVAGIGEQGNMFDPELTLESVQEEPKKSVRVIDVNLKGQLYFSRLASVYLRQGEGGAQDKSLTLVSSVAGFREDPGLYVYTASKHGVMGLMRSLRAPLGQAKLNPIRVNAICPWMTLTRLVAGIEQTWERAGLPANTAEDVAKTIAGVTADGKTTGGTMYIEGGRTWDIEKGLLATRHEWLGAEQEKAMDEGTKLMGGGSHWIDNKSSQV